PPRNQNQFKPCEWDNLRPGDGQIEIRRDQGIERPHVSRSVEVRHNYGRKQKQEFYRNETRENNVVDPLIEQLEFTNELDEIATSTQLDNLENKLAVVYVDGNGFGSIQRDHCKNAGELHSFDEKVQGYRRAFLKNFLLEISNDPDFKVGNQLRLETLLWGGDEINLGRASLERLLDTQLFLRAEQKLDVPKRRRKRRRIDPRGRFGLLSLQDSHCSYQKVSARTGGTS
ncbi:MAG: hypothetical protein ACREXS_19095, partial [Gammaproteobacteria bacterium]